MNTHALIPLIATVVYIALNVIVLFNRPWQRQQRLFFLFLIPAMMWSLSDIFFRSDFFMEYEVKLVLVKVVLCSLILAVVQFHYFLCSFFRPQRGKIPVAYVFVISTIALAALGYIPEGIEIGAVINVDYGITILVIGLLILFTLAARDIYSLVQRRKTSPDPSERNQIAYLLVATFMMIVFLFSVFAPGAGEYPLAHIGNLGLACILTYAVVAQRLVDVRVVFRRGLTWAGYYGLGIGLFALLFFLIHRLLDFDIDFATLALAFGLGMPIIIFLAHRVRGPLREGMERALIRQRYYYRKRLSDFTAKAHGVPSLEEFGSELVSLLSEIEGG
jgi:hypothetical protein